MAAILSRGYQQPWDGLRGITQVTEEKFGPSQGQEMMQMYFYTSCITGALRGGSVGHQSYNFVFILSLD